MMTAPRFGTYTIPTQSAAFWCSTFSINSRNHLKTKEIVGGPTRIRTWDQRIMSAFQAVTTYKPNQLTPKEV